MFILKKIARLLSSRPLKTMLIIMLLIAVMAVGAQHVNMATGNDTLVSSESDVYQENLALEQEFGGESIIVMYESDNRQNLLTVDNLEHMEKLHQQLEQHENIYSIISPVTLITQMAEKQADKYEEGLTEVIDGLDEMGGKLTEIGENLATSTGSSDTAIKSNTSTAEMNQGLTKMIEAQKKLQSGTTGLITGYEKFGTQIGQVAGALETTASSLPANQPDHQQLIKQLQQYSQQLAQLSEQMKQTSSKSAALSDVAGQTANGLAGIKTGLQTQQKQLTDMQTSQQHQLETKLGEAGAGLKEMGERLQTISDNLTTMQAYSDTLSPGLPEKQETLDYMLFDENGDLKDLFQELVIDDSYMMMSIKFSGNANDADKTEVVDLVDSYLEKHPLETAETFVSGKPVLDGAIRSSMQESMKKMMALSLVAMVFVLIVTFRIRWRLLPLGIVLLAVIGTVGFMGWSGIPITMVSMAVFPILIGLGIDYAIQFQSRYTEEMAESEDNYESQI